MAETGTWHFFNFGPDEGPIVLPDNSLFERAVELLLPDLSNEDPRFGEVVKWAKQDYAHYGKRIALLARIDSAESTKLSAVSNFLRKLELDPGRREVVVSGRHIFYTDDYKVPPTVVL